MNWLEKREQSYNYLNKYKNKISKDTYERIINTIGSQAIENIFATEKNIIDKIKVENNKVTADELIAKYIDNLKVS